VSLSTFFSRDDIAAPDRPDRVAAPQAYHRVKRLNNPVSVIAKISPNTNLEAQVYLTEPALYYLC